MHTRPVKRQMDIETLLSLRPPWAMEPCLYIVRQSPQANSNAFRCGASGTQLFSGTDLPYGSDRATFKGLLSRMVMYQNYWLPNRGTIHAALRIQKKLVALPGQRVGESQGEEYNISRGNQTLVLAREAEFHTELDKRGLRWQSERRNELFQPRQKVDELISAMRTVRGEDMYLFSKDGIREDPSYRGGRTRTPDEVREMQSRQLPTRTAAAGARAPYVSLRLSPQAIEALQKDDPTKYALLVEIVRAAFRKNNPGSPTTPQTPPVPVPTTATTQTRTTQTRDPPPLRTVAFTRTQRENLRLGRVTRSMGDALFGGL